MLLQQFTYIRVIREISTTKPQNVIFLLNTTYIDNLRHVTVSILCRFLGIKKWQK